MVLRRVVPQGLGVTVFLVTAALARTRLEWLVLAGVSLPSDFGETGRQRAVGVASPVVSCLGLWS